MLQTWLWIGFVVFVLAMLLIDLGVFHRKSHAVKMKEALIWCFVWITLATGFFVGTWFYKGHQKGIEFLTGYLIELSLSVDNLFVFLLIFSYFRVSPTFQHKVLYWGILGALIMRAIMIAGGIVLIHKFHWIVYVFGAFLVFSGIKLLTSGDTEVHPENNPVIKIARKLFLVTPQYHQDHFFVKIHGRRFATPMFLVLLMIETTDLIFAVDSIPAILAITQDTFIVYTSNVFAILGLRSFYFALAGMFYKFRFLKFGLSIVLGFVGVKMLIADWYKIPTPISLAVIVMAIGSAILFSFLIPAREEEPEVRANPMVPHENP